MQDTPVYIWETDTGNNFYGFPWQPGKDGGTGVKVARHYVNAAVKEDPQFSSTLGVSKAINNEKVQQNAAELRTLLQGRIPLLANGTLVHTAQCVYTMTPDEHL